MRCALLVPVRSSRFEGISAARAWVWREIRRVWEESRGGMGNLKVLSFGRSGRIQSDFGAEPETADGTARELLRLHAADELVRGGLLVRDHGEGKAFLLTPHGERCLVHDDGHLPLDDTGRAAKFASDNAGVPDAELMARYLAEAVRAYSGGMWLAGATMIGCAYELGMSQLALALTARPSGSEIQHLSADDRKVLKRVREGVPVSIAAVERAVVAALAADPKALGEHADWLKGSFQSSFALARLLRNDAGHPTARRVDADEVRAHIVLFPTWFRRVRSVILALQRQGTG